MASDDSVKMLGMVRAVGAKVTTKMQTTVYMTERELIEYTNMVRGEEAHKWKAQIKLLKEQGTL